MLMRTAVRSPAMLAAWIGSAAPRRSRHLPDPSEALYADLLRRATGHGNDRPFAAMVASYMTGGGALPIWLGLEVEQFATLIDRHFPGVGGFCQGECRRSGDHGRSDEQAELVALMAEHRAGDDESELWMATIVAVGCLGNDHLWQDLGLWSRKDLTALMRRNFPPLAWRNNKDMKWKRFLYKQLCEAEGIYTCRAPSCEVCTDYSVCFGPE